MRSWFDLDSALPEGASIPAARGALAPAGEATAHSYLSSPYVPPPDPNSPPPYGAPQSPYETTQSPYGSSQPPYGAPPPPASGPGLSIGAASALCYVFGFITGIIFLVLEPYKRDRLVRFHAFQSIFFSVGAAIVSVAWQIVSGLLAVVTHGLFLFVSVLVSGLLSLGFLIVWIILLVRASQGQKWVLPVIGPLAEKQASSATF